MKSSLKRMFSGPTPQCSSCSQKECSYSHPVLKRLPGECRKRIKSAQIEPHEALNNLALLLNVLIFEYKRNSTLKSQLEELREEFQKNKTLLPQREPNSFSVPLSDSSSNPTINNISPTISPTLSPFGSTEEDPSDETIGSLSFSQSSTNIKTNSQNNVKLKSPHLNPNRDPVCGAVQTNPVKKTQWQLEDEIRISLRDYSHFSFSVDPHKIYPNRVLVGKGSFGSVYTSYDEKTQTWVAAKILDTKYYEVNFICNEINVLNCVKHENILSYFGSYLWKTKVWMILEYCDGGSLRDLTHIIALKETHISFVISKIVSGLSHLHSLNWIHRDMKADNILVTSSANIKIADFGLTVQVAELEEKKKSLCGSRYWMPPEMIRNDGYSAKADVWSLGALLMEVLSGFPPYSDQRSFKAMWLIATRGAPPLPNHERWSDLILDFLYKCFVICPAQRPSSHELLHHPFLQESCPKEDFASHIEAMFLDLPFKHSGF